MRKPLDRPGLQQLFKVLGKAGKAGKEYQVYLTGGATAVEMGWRNSTLDADLSADPDSIFSEVQRIKETLNMNIEFAKPSDFVPRLPGEEKRHVFIKKIGDVHFYHYDPYSQAFSKIVRGFERDIDDVRNMISSGLVDFEALKGLVGQISGSEFSKYPNLSKKAVTAAIEDFVADKI